MAIVATYFAASSVLLLTLVVLVLLALLTHDKDPDPFVSKALIALIVIGAIVFSLHDHTGPPSDSVVEVFTSPTDFPTEDQHTIVSD
jgi:hypothetical protein